MRKGFLGALALLIGSSVAQAQQGPAYGYQQWPAYGYPQYSGYQQYPGYSQYSGYQQYPGYYYAPRQGSYYPGYQQAQQNSALVYPRAGYATPTYQQGNAPQSSTSYAPPPRVVSLPQTVSQTVPEPLPSGAETSLPSSAGRLVPEPVPAPPPAGGCGPAGCGPAACDSACEHNDLLVPPKEPCPPRPCKHECFWFAGNFLLAWTKPAAAVPLVTTGFAGVNGIGGDAVPGALGQPSTAVLFGQSTTNFGLIPGFKLDAGIWLDHDNCFSLDVSGFFLPLTHQDFATKSDANGNPLLTRPVINPITGLEDVFIVAFPGQVAGDIAISNTQILWGAEINARWHDPIGRHFSCEALAGIRYLNLIETLSISEDLVPIAGNGGSGLAFLGNPVNPPETLTTQDRFRTTNQFTGFQLGGAVRWETERFFFDLHAKGAVGVTQQSVQISGTSLLLGNQGILEAAAPAGILALPSTIGGHNRSVVSVVPEGGFTAGVNLTSWLRFMAGYSFLYWNNVVRPMNHIDRVVSSQQVPTDADFGATGGPLRPTFQFHEDSFWVHMFNIGLEFHY